MSLKQFELVLLGMLAFVLPSLETPKTLFWLLYVITFLVRQHREGNLWHVPQSAVTWVLWGMLLASVVSTMINWPIENGFKGVADVLRYATLFMCIYAGGYTEIDLRRIAYAIIGGALAGLGFGLLEVISNVNERLQFHSAGVVTQSAIYLGMVMVMTLGFIMRCRDLSWIARGLLVIALLAMAVALAYMGSRGSMLAVAAALGVIVLVNLRWRVVAAVLVGTIAVSVVSYLVIKAAPQNFLNEGHYERLSVERFHKADNERVEAWKVALARLAQGDSVVWGIGPKNFRSINPSDLGIDSAFYERAGVIHHAHNLFLNALVETGVIGLALLLGFYFLVGKRLFRQWRYAPDDSPGWAWYAGLGGMIVPIVAGSFNAPFSQEHAMLAMMLMAMMYVTKTSDRRESA